MVISTNTADWHIHSISTAVALATNDYVEVFIKASASVTVSFASGLLSIKGIAA
jgi:hypothetical protein